MQIVLMRETGETFPVVQLPGVTGSEITGPASTRVGSASTSAPSATPVPPTGDGDLGPLQHP